MTYHMPTIAITNESTALSDADAQAALYAVQVQVLKHFAPYWGMSAHLHWHDKTAPIVQGAWVVGIFDDSDQAGALGYHDLTEAGLPMAKVFAKTDQDNGLSVSVTISHEVLEMLGDPYVNQVVQIKNDGTALAYENCDATEADDLGYKINGVLVSDFVTPQWFLPGSKGPYDYKGEVSHPFEILPEGYIGLWQPGKGWKQVQNGRVRHDHGNRFQLRQRSTGVDHIQMHANMDQLLEIAGL